MNPILIQLFIKLFVFKTDKEYSFEVHEPGAHAPNILQEVQDFRKKHYTDRFPYLLSPLQAQIESKLQLDERSYQVVGRSKANGKIVGSLRLTPYPFELTELNDQYHLSKEEYGEKLEIGRLVIDPQFHNVGKKLMILAGIHSSEKTKFEGFIGVSRTEKISYFKNFGMRIISDEIQLKGRPMNYLIILSDFKTMRSNVMKNIVTRLITLPSFQRKTL
jgi:hypothetical protein